MTSTAETPAPTIESPPETQTESPRDQRSNFILYLDGLEYHEEFTQLSLWVRNLLMPVYGREITSNAPWCSCWWEHPEALAQLHGLWMAWQELTRSAAGRTGPATWHRDFLTVTMSALRDPSGPFAGCKPGAHRPKESPPIDEFPA
jgi:hypothetical protein